MTDKHFHRGVLHQFGALLVALTGLVDLLAIGCWYAFILFANGVALDRDYLLALMFVLIVFMGVGTAQSLYRSWRRASIAAEIFQLLTFWGIAVIALGAFLYIFEESVSVDARVLRFWFFSTPFLLAAIRVTVRGIAHKVRQMGCNVRFVAVIGATDIGAHIADSMERNPWMGLRFLGFFDSREPKSYRVDARCKNRGVDPIESLFRAIEEGRVHHVYIALPMRAQLRVQGLIERLAATNVAVYYAPDFYSFDLLHARWDDLEGQPVISVLASPFNGVPQIIKRLEDIAIALVVLLIAGLPMLVIASLIRLDSPGPAIFRQQRYGLDGRPFEIWKFRTMAGGSEDGGFKQATRNDPRVTRIGAFLRRTSIDELPQILHVLFGQMSVVGPRPHPIALDEAHQQIIRRYGLRYRVKPGITGWAQVNGHRGETDTPGKMEARVAHDLEYIRNWSIWFDCKILYLTIFATLKGQNAY